MASKRAAKRSLILRRSGTMQQGVSPKEAAATNVRRTAAADRPGRSKTKKARG